MKILVTGATGYIGTHLCQLLSEKGHEVWGVSRKKKEAQAQHPSSHSWVDWEDLKQVKKVEAVINLAGASIAQRWTSSYKKILRRSRIDLSQKLISDLDTSDLKVFLQASATGIYKPLSSDAGPDQVSKITESSSKDLSFLGDLVCDWEKVSENLGVRRVYFRKGMVLGAKSPALLKMLPVFQKGFGAALGTGQQYMPWVHIEDVCRAYCEALEDETYQGVYNLVAPELVTNEIFTRKTLEVLKKKAWAPAVPGVILRLALGPMCRILLDSLPVWPERLIQSPFQFKYKTIENTLKASLD